MRRALGVVLVGISGLGVVALACGDNGAVTLAPTDAADFDAIRPRGVGERCDDGGRCRPGLVCADGACAPGHAVDEGQPCTISAECKDGLYCSADHKCTHRGTNAAGDSCASEVDCASGLRCNAVGLSAECEGEGGHDVGLPCATSAECFGGLVCAAKICTPYNLLGIAPPIAVNGWKGVDCTDDPGPAAGYFRVPRGSGDGDFFRLPFPNDVRRKGGKLDLSGFPTPGSDVLGYDLVERWRAYAETSVDGFSVYPTITMRFTPSVDFTSLNSGAVLKMIDVTTGGSGESVGFGFTASPARSPYVCANAITARPAAGLPLASGHTYALYVSGLKATDGSAVTAAPDLKASLGSVDPGAPLSDAWTAYAPFRTWAAGAGLDLATVANATVFTVGHHLDLMKGTASATAAATIPAVSSWVKCGAAPSPCPQATGDRACGGGDPAFDELHALVTLPIWQKGKAPFVTPDDGGDVVLDAAGAPTAQGSEQVCMSLTVPKTTMPGGGWPVVIYAPEAGGSFRSSMIDGIAQRFAQADGGAAAIAVLTIDPVGSGTRRGGTDTRPASLWFGTQNPAAWRGRNVQAAADLMLLARLAPAIDLTAGASPTGAAIKLGKPILAGHGQGATATALAAPRANVTGIVLAGISAALVDIVPTKRLPVDYADVAPVVLGETVLTDASVVLSLFENAVDQVDPIAHASSLVTVPITQARDTFAIYGQGDGFTSGITQRTYTFAAGLGIAAPPPSVTTKENIGAPILPVPAGGNFGAVTAIVRQYAAASYEGHYVVFRDPDAIKDLDRFVADVALGKTPKVGR